jgi:hypothetical protein
MWLLSPSRHPITLRFKKRPDVVTFMSSEPSAARNQHQQQSPRPTPSPSLPTTAMTDGLTRTRERTGVGFGRGVSGVKELLDHKVDTSVTRLQRADGATPCRTAVAAKNGEGMTLLYFAYKYGVTKMVEYLLEKGANREAEAIYGLTQEMLRPLSAYSESLRLLSR